jgi:hypothetical protein
MPEAPFQRGSFYERVYFHLRPLQTPQGQPAANSAMKQVKSSTFRMGSVVEPSQFA